MCKEGEGEERRWEKRNNPHKQHFNTLSLDHIYKIAPPSPQHTQYLVLCAHLADDLPLRFIQNKASLLEPLPVDVSGRDGKVTA